MTQEYTEKLITLELVYSDTQEAVLLEGFRVNVAVVPGFNGFDGTLDCAIEGLSLEKMYRLTAIGFIKSENTLNQITVWAGDVDSMQIVYKGTIYEAYIDASYQPDIIFRIHARSSGNEAFNAVKATSFKGNVKVSDVFKSLADESNGLAFENVNVDKQIENPYLVGSTLDKIRQFARYTNINFSIDKRVLSIWDSSKQQISGGNIITVSANSPDATLLKYPTPSGKMIEIDILFTNKVNYSQTINVESELYIANGHWGIRQIAHNLQSKDPGGVWFTHLSCDRVILNG